MATLAESLVPSSSRRLPVRMRPDLIFRKQRYQGKTYWVVKDPLALQYFRFEEEEFAILQMLDGSSSLEEIAEQFEADFPPQTIRVEELQQFLGHLYSSGLIITSAMGQGEQLLKKSNERTKKERLATWTNILAIRFKGFDPERILNVLDRYFGWFFSLPSFYACCFLCLSALTLVLVQFDTFQEKLPTFQSFFAAQNWLWLGVTLGVTKMLHEFGHGLSCKHFGGECHEIGVMFLVLTPCLYCNVSDSWMLPNRWHRATIGAAGMYVEVVLASLCTFIWWFTEPGPLHYTCLNVMFISSVSTILFNANPLLRYDGYYILSDIMEIPNLRQKASTILSRKLGKWCLGLEEPEDPFLPKRNQAFFALYTVASAIYRWVVVLSIIYFLNKVFEPYGLKPVGQLIAVGSLYGLLIQPLWKVFKFFRVPGRVGKVNRVRMYTSIVLLLSAISAVLFVPLPSSVVCNLVVHPRDAQSVYIEVPGRIVDVHVKGGDLVARGDLLAELEDDDIRIAIRELEGECEINRERLKSLQQMSLEDDRVGGQIALLNETIKTTEDRLQMKREDAARLRIVSPVGGTVFPPTLVPESEHGEERLPTWSGSPLKRENLGALLPISTKLCEVGNPNRLEARLLIDQNDVALVEQGQQVEILIEHSTEFVYQSTIQKMATDELSQTPSRLSGVHGGPIPTQPDMSGVPRPLKPYYEAIVPLPKDSAGLVRPGLTGLAKIQTAPRTLASRLYRYVARTFNFEL